MPVDGLDGTVTERVEETQSDPAHGRFIFDEEDGESPSPHRGQRDSTPPFGLGRGGADVGQHDNEVGPFPGLGFKMDRPLVALHDAVDRGEN